MIHVDHHPSIEDAVTAWLGQGGELALGPRSYDLAQPIDLGGRSNLSIRGEGNATRLVPRFPDGHVIKADGGAGECRNLLFDGFMIAAPTRRVGAGLYLRKTVRTTIRNVDVGTPDDAGWMMSHGVHTDGFDDLVLDDVQLMAWWAGWTLNGLANQGWGADAWLGGGSKIMTAPTIESLWPESRAVHIGGAAGGVALDASDLIYADIGVLVDTALAGGQQNREVFCGSTLYVDSCGQDGVRLGAKSAGTFHASGTWIASCGLRTQGGNAGRGLEVNADNGQLVGHLSGCRIFNHRGDGAAIGGGWWLVDGCIIDTNGRYGLHRSNAKAQITRGANAYRANKSGDWYGF